MDMVTYDQFSLSREDLGEQANYLSDGMEMKAMFFEGKILDLELPAAVELKVVEAEAGTKGDTASGGATKRAILANGLKIQVPLFIQTGEVVRVSTKTGKFLERA